MISIHALREEGDRAELYPRFARYISIHALREEGDFALSVRCFQPSDFYPRPPRGGRRSNEREPDPCKRFLSTPSARRATGGPQRPRGNSRISIHALREEGDQLWGGRTRPLRDFYPRPPRGGRHIPAITSASSSGISIHALREEGDHIPAQVSFRPRGHFYPRPPRGGRRVTRCSRELTEEFLSTPSARRATLRCAGPAEAQTDFYPRPPRGGRP